MQQYQNPFGNFPQSAPTGAPQQPGIAPVGAGAPVPGPNYGAPAPGYPPQHQYGAPAPAGFAPPQATYGDPFAKVGRVPLTRGEKLWLKAPDMVLAEMTCAKIHRGPQGLNVIFELRVLWSERGINRVGTEPSVVLRQNYYFDAEVTTWMCALLGIQEGRDQSVIEHLSATDQWSKLCHLATSSADGTSRGPGPFSGTIVLLDCYLKPKQDRYGNKVLDAQGNQKYTDLARPEVVAQSIGDALRYMRTCANPAQDPHAQTHYNTIKAALERRLPVPPFDPNALTARIQAASGAPAAPSQPAPAQAPQPGYGAPAQQAPGYGGPGYGPQPGTPY